MVTIFLWYQIISYKMICKIIKCLSWLCFKCTSPSIQTVGHVFPLKDSCTYQNLYGSAKLLFSTEPRYYKGQIEHCMYRDIALRSEYLHFFLSNVYSIRQKKKSSACLHMKSEVSSISMSALLWIHPKWTIIRLCAALNLMLMLYIDPVIA